MAEHRTVLGRGVAWAGALACAAGAAKALPPVPVPAENPITEQKRVLGKILFFDEQLSMSNTVACASCHVSGRGGADPRLARNPGVDGVLNTPDDIVASPGVIHADTSNNYVRDAIYSLAPQITSRAAPSPINAAYAPEVFWDGRAHGTFVDPQTGATDIVSGGALESQSVNPPVSSVEMAHEGMDWNLVTAKLQRVNPLDLATNIPSDMGAAISGNPGYPELFRRAFGDTAITAQRVAFAVATFERTLISDQTPWDAFSAGNNQALTQGQQAGLQTFQGNCAVCHTPPMFTDQSFRNIGLRPTTEDLGRQNVTGNTADRGKFKVPSLRNVGLQRGFMHNGEFPSVGAVVGFYARAPGAPPQFGDNQDPQMHNINVPPQAAPALIDFVSNALTDPRVAAQTFPFDRPVLFTERAQSQATIIGGGSAGTGGFIPRIFAPDPAMVGNLDYRIGLDLALPGASATLVMSASPPVNGTISPDHVIGTATASGTAAGNGLGTVHWPLNSGQVTGGTTIYLQWIVQDAGAAGGQARSSVAQVPVFCGSSGCVVPCGYANCDGSVTAPYLNVADLTCFLQKFQTGDPYANCDGSTSPPVLNVSDFTCFLQKFAMGCTR